MAEQSWI